jgi:hypothetical protein
MKRLLREPLVHFLVLGAALFVAFDLTGKSTGGAPGTIVVTKAQADALAAGFARTWQRPPNADEREELIQDRVREEIYCREAIALGLDKDDPVIRRRLRQKMEFVSEDAATEPEPTESDLQRYLAAHADAFRVEPRITFRHVYLDPARHPDSLAADARRLVDKLNRQGREADISRVGDRFLLDHTFDAVPVDVIARQFGETFAAKLGELPLHRWQGPVESGYGAHLVYVGARVPGRKPELIDVRDAVRREWVNAHRLEANEAFYRELRKRYRVTIER